ncbi:MAG: aspartyl-tRNA(Asn)/glutamyl-tRNA(Gln) amidotransferase subunit [Thermoleophilaceae bacterium]|nr:aspartyl-tRNA(Asn)/glutamyl-tRNA(Gln) amidotransferase subunit [Thermoleophilaceae bacterium]
MSHPQDLSLRAQADAVRSGELDAGELLDATLARFEERNGDLNAVVATFPEQSRRMLDEAPDGPLRGVPVGIKDEFSIPWRAPRNGSSIDAIPAGESAVFRRLRDAGAVVAGVTQMHFWGAGTTGHVSAYGPVGNPWDPTRCAGGSSGGSASAVGGRMLGAAVGADGGGSVRLPAAYCGVTGLKLTNNVVPRDGHVHAHSALGAFGPLCRDAADARLFGSALLARDLTAGDGSGLRVGVVRDPFWDDIDPSVEKACRDALDAAGWDVEEISLEGAEHSLIATVVIITVEALPEFSDEDLAAADPLSRALIKYERMMPAEALARAMRVRSQLRRAVASAFETYDAIAWPTVPAVAPPIENPTVERPSGPSPAEPANVGQAGLGNLTGIPGINVPVGFNEDGMPIGLMLQAAWNREELLLDAAEHIEQATGRRHVDAEPPIAAPAG